MATINVKGRLGRDPKVIEGKNGKFVSASIAEDYAKDQTRWWDLTFNGDLLVNQVERFKLKKGSAIDVWGRFGTRTYTDKNGVEQTVFTISVSQFEYALTSGNTSSDASVTENKSQGDIKEAMKATSKKEAPKVVVQEEDDLPF